MAPLATTRSIVRRLTDPERPRIAVGLMVLASSLLFAAVLVALPSPAEGSDTPVIDIDTTTSSTELVSAPSKVVIATPRDGQHHGSVIVNHRRANVSLDARLANGEGLSVELSEAGPRATDVTVTSDAVHQCGRYAGTLILEATAPQAASDVVVLDVRYAECGDPEVPTMAPDSVNDTSPTWADDGRAPWKASTPSAPAPPPPPPAPEPQPEAQAQAAEPTPAPEPTTEDSSAPEPVSTASEVLDPEPEPTSSDTVLAGARAHDVGHLVPRADLRTHGDQRAHLRPVADERADDQRADDLGDHHHVHPDVLAVTLADDVLDRGLRHPGRPGRRAPAWPLHP